jgi:hypothetical protein
MGIRIVVVAVLLATGGCTSVSEVGPEPAAAAG